MGANPAAPFEPSPPYLHADRLRGPRITDFDPGTDKLVFKDAGRLNWDDVDIGSDHGNTVLSVGGDHIELVGVRVMRLALNISSEREPTCRFGNFHVFAIGRSAMRRAIFAFTVAFLAPAAMALSAGGDSELGAAGSAVQRPQILPGGVAGSDEGGLLWGKVILAKGDRTGTGPGAGGQKGQKKGNGNSGGKGKQKGKKG